MPDLGPGLRLHLNENTGGCSPKVVEAVRAFDGPALATYPDFRDAILETAAFLGVDPDRIVLTNGLDEGILLASIAYLGHRTPEALVAARRAADDDVGRAGDPGGAAGVRAVSARRAFAGRPRRVGAGRPGLRVSARRHAARDHAQHAHRLRQQSEQSERPADCRRTPFTAIAREAGHALVFVDEAYHDFLGENFLAEAADYPNVLIGRTFSKAFGLAGMRVGVMIASPAILAPIRRCMPLFNLNVVAVAALRAAIGDPSFRDVVHRAGQRVEGAGLCRRASGPGSGTGRAPRTSC